MGKRSRKRNRFRTAGSLALADSPRISAQVPKTARVKPDQEYLSGTFSAQEVRWLPAAKVDPKSPEITFETYRRMLNDPEIAADVWLLKYFVLADGIQLTPAVDGVAVDSEDGELDQAQEYASFTERNFAGLRKPLQGTLEQMLDAIPFGHKVAEVTWKFGEGDDQGKLVLDKIAPKPHNVLEFVLDQFNNLLGFTPKTHIRNLSALSGRPLLPADKFAILSLREEDDDPRGNAGLRPAINGWNFKQRVWPEYFRWLENCALPSIVGTLAPKQPGDVQRNQDGGKAANGKLLSPTDAMLNSLLELKNASVAVIPNGAAVDQLQVVGEGAGFELAINVADNQVTKAILFQTLATNEAQFGTRAQAGTHMQVLDLLVWYVKGKVAEMLDGIVKQIIRYNFGDEALRFAPIVTLGDTERRDWATDASAAALLEPSMTDSQWLHIVTQLGIPAPLPGERPRREAIQAQMQDQVQTSVPGQSDSDEPEEEASPRRFRPRAHGKFITIKARRAA